MEYICNFVYIIIFKNRETMTKFSIFYKGNRYFLEINSKELINAYDEEGFKIFNPQLLHNLEYIFFKLK